MFKRANCFQVPIYIHTAQTNYTESLCLLAFGVPLHSGINSNKAIHFTLKHKSPGMLWCLNISSVLWLYQYVSILWKATKHLYSTPFESFCSQNEIFCDFFFYKDEILVSPPVTTMREGITENSQIRTICQVGQRAGDAGCSPGGWHSEHGDDTPRYHSQARPPREAFLQSRLPRELRVHRGMRWPSRHTQEFKPPTGPGPTVNRPRGSASQEWQDLQEEEWHSQESLGCPWWYSG